MRIVVDAMGGDHAPDVVVQGAVRAVQELGVEIVLVGPVDTIRPLAVRTSGSQSALDGLPVEFEEAPEVVEMDELPLPAMRKKKRSTIRVGLRLVRDGAADAFVSAGNTGAVMATATVLLGRLPGVERPALAAMVPSGGQGYSVLLDVGANVSVRAKHLEQFAVMGSCLCRALWRVDEPQVALLSVGEEDVKGSDLIRRVHEDLRAGPVNFVGNVDGKDVFSGTVDVIVMDGFTGNAVIKSAESLISELMSLFRREVRASLRARLGYLFLAPSLRRLQRRLDHAEYGAVPLLGVRKPVFIGHGSSSAKSIYSAIRVARTFVDSNVNQAIQEQLGELAAAREVADHADPPQSGRLATGGER